MLDIVYFADRFCERLARLDFSTQIPLTSPTLAADVMTLPCAADAEEGTLYLRILRSALDSIEGGT